MAPAPAAPPLGFYYKIGGKFMGKRELFIIVGFIVVGAVAYQFAAPPETEEGGLSISRFMDELRREVRGNPGTATVESTGSIALAADLTELRVGGAPRGVDVIGEDRDDIAYTLEVESNGPTDAEAETYAKAVRVEHDDLGFAYEVRLWYPDEGRQSARLTLRVPARLAIRLEGRSVSASGVSEVELDNAVGDTRLRGISGRVRGTHRGGELTIEQAGEIDLALTGSRSEISGVSGRTSITARSGTCLIRDAAGPIEIQQTNLELEVTGSRDVLRITGTGGEIIVADPIGEVRVDARRSEVEIRLGVGAPINVITDRDRVRLLLSDDTAIELDAVATDDGEVLASEFDLAPEQNGDAMRLMHTFGAGPAPRVTLRNSDGDIEIRRRR